MTHPGIALCKAAIASSLCLILGVFMRLSCISFLKEEKSRFFKQFTFCIVMFSSIIVLMYGIQEYCGWQNVSFFYLEWYSFCHYFYQTGKHSLKWSILYCTICYALMNELIISISIYHSSLRHLIQWSYIWYCYTVSHIQLL